MSRDYQIVIIGAGPGGYVSALKAAKLGATVALVEQDRVGGTCLNRGCIPTKVMLEAAHRYHLATHSEDYGVRIGEASFDYEKCLAKRDEVVATLVSGVEKLISASGVDLLRGEGRLLAGNRVEVEGVGEIGAERIILATGSHTSSLPGLTIDGKTILDSDQLLMQKKMPKSLLVVGGGAVGLEFANFYSVCGIEVYVVEIMAHILPLEERRIASGLSRYLQNLGIKIFVNTTVEKVQGKDGLTTVTMSSGEELQVEWVLLSVGRRPNTENFSGIKGLELDERGYVSVDEYMATSLPGVYAVGDMVNSPALAHVASREGIVAVRNALGGQVKMDYSAVPGVVYTFMEVARVGPTEDELKERGIPFRTGQFSFRPIGKALAMDMADGVVRMHVEEKSGRLLSASILAPHAGDLIAELTLSVKEGLTYSTLEEVIHAHPTLSEVVGEVSGTLGEGAIHGL